MFALRSLDAQIFGAGGLIDSERLVSYHICTNRFVFIPQLG